MNSIFFDSQVAYDEDNNPIYDRANNSSDLRKSFKSFISNGVYATPSTEFQVTAGSGMTINVLSGRTWIEGAFAWETDTRELLMQASDTQDRIDRVVLRLDLSLAKRNIDLYVLKGTAAGTPIAPVLTRNDTIYEIALADIFITKNTATISQSRITDTRLNTSLCGIVTGVITQVDTTALYSQVQADGVFNKVTENSLIELVADVCKRHKLDPLIDVIRHYDITRKRCPLDYVENPKKWDRFIEEVDNLVIDGIKIGDEVMPNWNWYVKKIEGDMVEIASKTGKCRVRCKAKNVKRVGE